MRIVILFFYRGKEAILDHNVIPPMTFAHLVVAWSALCLLGVSVGVTQSVVIHGCHAVTHHAAVASGAW